MFVHGMKIMENNCICPVCMGKHSYFACEVEAEDFPPVPAEGEAIHYSVCQSCVENPVNVRVIEVTEECEGTGRYVDITPSDLQDYVWENLFSSYICATRTLFMIEEDFTKNFA